MKRALAIVCAFVLLSAGATGLLQPPAARAQGTPPPTRTEVRYYLTFVGDQVHPGLTISEEVTGDCSEQSLVVSDRQDAFFCQEISGAILDPCFANPMKSSEEPTDLVCADSPFTDSVIHLTTTRALLTDASGTHTESRATTTNTVPWALVLANGKECGVMRGATSALAGMRINLACVGGGYIFGDLLQSGPVWYANYTDQSTPDSTQVAVVTVWS